MQEDVNKSKIYDYARADADAEICPAKALLRLISGKWKAEILKLSADGPQRFGQLLRCLEGSNRQSLAVALRELQEAGLIEKRIVARKPLHIEYFLSEKGHLIIPVLIQLEQPQGE
ncbi:MAG: helix-turn-helix transcriptional regulator [Bacteroidetes bacterium]|jgi:DNA-binding HxlR family transcriptional regulator|nr:helix-turn-helix transcriptional regulator [Bacteroidota bacterium]